MPTAPPSSFSQRSPFCQMTDIAQQGSDPQRCPSPRSWRLGLHHSRGKGRLRSRQKSYWRSSGLSGGSSGISRVLIVKEGIGEVSERGRQEGRPCAAFGWREGPEPRVWAPLEVAMAGAASCPRAPRRGRLPHPDVAPRTHLRPPTSDLQSYERINLGCFMPPFSALGHSIRGDEAPVNRASPLQGSRVQPSLAECSLEQRLNTRCPWEEGRGSGSEPRPARSSRCRGKSVQHAVGLLRGR